MSNARSPRDGLLDDHRDQWAHAVGVLPLSRGHRGSPGVQSFPAGAGFPAVSAFSAWLRRASSGSRALAGLGLLHRDGRGRLRSDGQPPVRRRRSLAQGLPAAVLAQVVQRADPARGRWPRRRPAPAPRPPRRRPRCPRRRRRPRPPARGARPSRRRAAAPDDLAMVAAGRRQVLLEATRPRAAAAAVCWRIVPMRRSTITSGTSTVASVGDGVDHHAPEQLVHLRLGRGLEPPRRCRRAARRACRTR